MQNSVAIQSYKRYIVSMKKTVGEITYYRCCLKPIKGTTCTTWTKLNHQRNLQKDDTTFYIQDLDYTKDQTTCVFRPFV